ncbi:hypothetical protein BJF78_30295 [Pseudonocardia sp. CNS-139]|nr:hypothetical protein BJF78_30295 [Pseudonocardia sp. CNS-139]
MDARRRYLIALSPMSLRMGTSPIVSFQASTWSVWSGKRHSGCGKSDAYMSTPSPSTSMTDFVSSGPSCASIAQNTLPICTYSSGVCLRSGRTPPLT